MGKLDFQGADFPPGNQCTHPLCQKKNTFECDFPFSGNCRLVGYGLVPFDQKGTTKIAPPNIWLVRNHSHLLATLFDRHLVGKILKPNGSMNASSLTTNGVDFCNDFLKFPELG